MVGDTSSEQIFERVQELFHECRAHEECDKREPSKANNQKIWPKRLLDVSRDLVILCEGCKPDQYACLSHCWGPPEKRPIITTKDTIAQFRDGIPFERLSKTFQHAVDVCRRIGTNYIWIDSLCIVQDSTEDWKEEAVKMGSIYQNAVFTIAATRSSDGNGGCYSSATAKLPRSVLVPGTNGVRVRPHPGLSLPSRFHARLPETSKEWPLLSRAWVYQEMRLSRRILHFCHGEIVWQCRQLTCQVNSGECRYNSDENAFTAIPRAVTNSAQAWHGIVHNYSSLMLTHLSDRLPALAAIAEQTMKLRDPEDRYLAGLWEKTLLPDLQWFRADTSAEEGGKYKGIRLVSARMPSWSWASVDVRVLWKDEVLHGIMPSAVQLIEVIYEANGPAVLGSYLDSQLVFRAPLLSSTLAALCIRHCRITDERMYGNHLDVEWFRSDYGLDTPGPGHVPPDTAVYLLPLAIVETKIFTICNSLVLIKRPDWENRPFYERIGFARLEDPVQMNQFLQWGLQIPVHEVDGYFDDAKERFERAFLSLPRVEVVLI